MDLRWPRYLPEFPAVLLMPVVLIGWSLLCIKREGPPFGGWGSDFPFWFQLVNFGPGYGWAIMGIFGFVADLSLALGAAWALAMLVDKAVFPWIRARR